MPEEDERAYAVAQAQAGERLDVFLARAEADLSRNRVQALIRDGHVRVDGKTVTEPKARVNAGATVRLLLPEPEDAAPSPEPIPLDILYEDPHVVVLDKPVGLVVHPAPGNPSGTLVNALLHHCGPGLAGIGGVRRPGIVHRLDKDTSGVMVVAKTEAAMRGLGRQFADHGREGPLERRYTALVWGAPFPPSGEIDLALGRDPRNPLRRAVLRTGGKPAVTLYRTEEVYGAKLASRLDCRLLTGRTHQIRVHLAASGHPVLGDPLYGAGFRTKAARLPEAAREALDALPGQALHARVLGFEHPLTGAFLRFESPEPDGIVTLIARLQALEA